MSGPQCCANPPDISSDSRQDDHIEVIGGLTSYTAGSPASKVAVILIADIYGTFFFLTIYQLSSTLLSLSNICLNRIRFRITKTNSNGTNRRYKFFNLIHVTCGDRDSSHQNRRKIIC
ncbi:hypothetical protein Hdeb2414_s0407g00887551 [Helianthus debilis subsp. tardiflorus]